jgi:hypothetical protein
LLLEEHINEPFGVNLNTIDLNNYLDRYSAIVEFCELFDQGSEDLSLLDNKILKDVITILDNFLIDSISNSSEFSDWIRYIVNFDQDENTTQKTIVAWWKLACQNYAIMRIQF